MSLSTVASPTDRHLPTPPGGVTPPWKTLTVMGDSIAAGLGDLRPGLDEPWSVELARRLGIDPSSGAYRNLGDPGRRVAEIRQQQLEVAVASPADLTIVTAGGNDMFGRRFDLDHIAGELDAILAGLADVGSEVVTFGLFDVTCTELVPVEARPALRDRTLRLNDTTRVVTERHGGHFVDFFDHPAQSRDIFSADQLHVNHRGHAVIVAEVLAALAPAMAR